MDFSPIINQALIALWYLIPIAIFAGVIKSPWFKGLFGEFLVNTLFRVFLPRDEYHLIKNVTLPTESGSTQIDHIIVSKYGIFVVETKNLKGWIFGKANQKEWTQKIYKFSAKFQNPIHQNYKHLKTLQGCLGISPDSIFSVIIFIGDSTFKTEMPGNVSNARGSLNYIKSKQSILFNDEQLLVIVNMIEEGRLTRGLKTNREHVSHVKEIIQSKSLGQVCPRCGSNMKLRETKKGSSAGIKFWGCSAFPKCRGTVDIANPAL
jgi:restriction system protein